MLNSWIWSWPYWQDMFRKQHHEDCKTTEGNNVEAARQRSLLEYLTQETIWTFVGAFRRCQMTPHLYVTLVWTFCDDMYQLGNVWYVTLS